MINIHDKRKCVGCGACQQICPVKCIAFHSDNQGFDYPKVDLTACIRCGLCEKVCPVIHQADQQRPLHTFGAKVNNPAVLQRSSSGGVFHALASHVIAEGGIVFGAKFNSEWLVEHDSASSIENAVSFMGSKYVQSHIGKAYIEVREALNAGKKVLFSGAPCQVAGLRLFLRKDYGDQLILVDFVCHGVPSPKIWQQFLKHTLLTAFEIPFKLSDVESISFRDKRNGWENYGLCIRLTDGRGELFMPYADNIYMQGFLGDLYLRPSCFECPAKCGKSHSDFTLGDFWGVRHAYPALYSPEGLSLLMVNTNKALKILKQLPLSVSPVDYEAVVPYNKSITTCAQIPEGYVEFWKRYPKQGLSIVPGIINPPAPTFLERCRRSIRYRMSFLFRPNFRLK